MSLDFYFKPVEKIDFKKETIGFKSDIFFKDFPDWEKSDIVIISVDENRGDSSLKPVELNHQNSREIFYQFRINADIKIADLGILQAGAELSDTFLALKEITTTVQRKDKLLIVLGGSQDLTYANYLGYQELEKTVNLTCIDNKFDVEIENEDEINNDNFINHLLLQHPSFLFNFSVLGFQQFYSSEQEFRFFDDLYFDYIRLGELQRSIDKAEPILRNTDILSFDLSSLRFAEFKGSTKSGPNGFFANEVCQLMKYAGISDKLSSIGIYNQIPGEISLVDSELISQFLFFIVEGFSSRKNDFPVGSKKDHLKYSVFHDDFDHNLVFHKSPKSERWWLEVPYPPSKDFKFERHHLIPCDYDDYLIAQKGVIPDLWWRTYRKLN
jgi:arginase family enzyme